MFILRYEFLHFSGNDLVSKLPLTMGNNNRGHFGLCTFFEKNIRILLLSSAKKGSHP